VLALYLAYLFLRNRPFGRRNRQPDQRPIVLDAAAARDGLRGRSNPVRSAMQVVPTSTWARHADVDPGERVGVRTTTLGDNRGRLRAPPEAARAATLALTTRNGNQVSVLDPAYAQPASFCAS
jgi:hypothetical protein